MKHSRKNNRAFTLVELVIVIAVIAILAAVLIMAFSGVIRKANISKDTELIRNLNTALIMDKALGGKHPTMTAVLQTAEEAGYLVDRINASAIGNEILWDSVNDLFCYFDKDNDGKITYIPDFTPEEDSVDHVDYFVIKDKISDEFSTYYTGNQTDIVTTKGFDAGKTTCVKTVTYTNNADDAVEQKVIIRTNSFNTELGINAPKDTISVYGYGKYLNIQECAPTSVHVFGYFPAGEITKGRVINEAGKVDVDGTQKDAGVGLLWINAATTQTAEGYTKFEDVKVGAANGASLPELARGAVSIAPTGTLVVETQVIEGDSTKTESVKEQDYIWLFKAGIEEQMVVTEDKPEAIATVVEGKPVLNEKYTMLYQDTSVSEANEKAAIQLANDAYKGSNGNYAIWHSDTRTYSYDVKPEDIESADVLYIYDKDKEELVKETIASGSIIGDGLTPETAFQIYDYDTMQVISKFYNDGYRYYKVCIEKTNNGHIDCSDWVSVNLNGEFDGAGVIFDNVDDTLFNTAYDMPTIKLSNFTVNANISGDSWGAPVLYASALSTYMDNVTVHGYIQATNAASSFTVWGYYIHGTHNWYFNNCYSDATIQSNCCGAFIAHPYNNDNNGTYAGAYVYLNNTLYDGAMIATNSSQYICGNHTSAKQNENGVFMNFTDSTLYSRYTAVCKTKLTENTNGNGYKYQYGSSTGATAFNSMCDYIKSSKNEVIYHNLDGIEVGSALSVQKNESTATAQAYFVISPNDVNETGCYTGTFLKDEFKAFTGDTITTENVKYYTVAINADGASETGVSGTVYNVVSDVYGKTFAGANITIVQYDADGKLVQTDCLIIK